jgi:hypothetical protein
MTTNWTLLVLSLNGFVLAAAVAANGEPQPVVVNRLTGTLHVQQGVPCGNNVDLTTAVTGGRLELTRELYGHERRAGQQAIRLVIGGHSR